MPQSADFTFTLPTQRSEPSSSAPNHTTPALTRLECAKCCGTGYLSSNQSAPVPSDILGLPPEWLTLSNSDWDRAEGVRCQYPDAMPTNGPMHPLALATPTLERRSVPALPWLNAAVLMAHASGPAKRSSMDCPDSSYNAPIPPCDEPSAKRQRSSRPRPKYVPPEPTYASNYPAPGFTERLRVYTDGAATNNGRRNARAGLGVYFGPGDPRNVSETLLDGRQTNQRAELMAIKRAIEKADLNTPLEICTDSQYSINCITKWGYHWEFTAWKTATGSKVVNADVIQDIRQVLAIRPGPVIFRKVRAHSGDPGNNKADRLAVRGAKKLRP
ncbi:hypothetical protein H4R33_004130 [Dimargaris cristalligena]|nr:hypothetical protein H4R33_004130 [Dimargaris cristalligena]